MPSDPRPPAFDTSIRELIQNKAHQVVRRGRLSRSDLPDVEQDLTAHVWERLARFDPARTDRAVFVRMLVGHAAATALRGRRCRARRAAQPLDAAMAVGEAEPVDPRAWPGPERATGLALDVEAVLAALPRGLRRVARAVSTRSVTAAARHLGMSRPTLYRRLRDLRAAFVAAGFDESGAAPRTRRRRPG